jgi:hypothetical protein
MLCKPDEAANVVAIWVSSDDEIEGPDTGLFKVVADCPPRNPTVHETGPMFVFLFALPAEENRVTMANTEGSYLKIHDSILGGITGDGLTGRTSMNRDPSKIVPSWIPPPGFRHYRKSPDAVVPKSHLTIQNPEKPSANRSFGTLGLGGPPVVLGEPSQRYLARTVEKWADASRRSTPNTQSA